MKKAWLFLPVLLIPFTLFSQTVLKSGSDSSGVKKSIHVTVMNPNGKTDVAYNGRVMHTDSVSDAFKFNITNLARGDFQVYYERRLSDAWSLEGGLGVTYIDYGYELFANGARYFSWANQGKSNSKFYWDYAGGFQLRYFLSKYETAITGYYFALGGAYRAYKMDYLVYNGLISIPHPLNRTWTDLKVQFGYQNADPYEHMFWEWFVSLGARMRDETRAEFNMNDVTFQHEKWTSVVLGGGIKVGFTL